ncbi:MAG TPA: ferrous iron transport protein B [Synergistaceae bacterium]|nr:ferrous iron transport protein B [Synergistaceae bacterium]
MGNSAELVVALAGQPNCGKSTVFNMITGGRQHVANYPGVTVDIKEGVLSSEGTRIRVADLPGTYGLSSFSNEERVARDFILHQKPHLVVNVVDTSNIKRHLYLTLQLLEMGAPVMLNLNMTDVADARGVQVDPKVLGERLGIPVVTSIASQGKGKRELRQALKASSPSKPLVIPYGDLEPFIARLKEKLAQACPEWRFPLRWSAIKLLEQDESMLQELSLCGKEGEEVGELLLSLKKEFTEQHDEAPEEHIAFSRHLAAKELAQGCVITTKKTAKTLTDRIDSLVLNKALSLFWLAGVIYLLYELAIVKGYELTAYTWPYLAAFRSWVASLLPPAFFYSEPLFRALTLSVVDAVLSVLNYVPIFLILFACIAILEDSGYMPRMAFILDRLFRRFGLHGQSTLPLILGGVFVGGCAVPGVMATRVISDEQARLATILVVPLMNCMAKIPLYTLLVNVYFTDHKGLAMFFISTITIIVALMVAKILTLTVLRSKERSPFVMEMPPYHLPTLFGVGSRTVERTWLFVKKVGTIIMLVAIVIYGLTTFPGLSENERQGFESREQALKNSFLQEIEENPAGKPFMNDSSAIDALLTYWDSYQNGIKQVRSKEAKKAFLEEYRRKNPDFFAVVLPGRNTDAKAVQKAFKVLVSERGSLQRSYKEEVISSSLLGRLGILLEPVTRWAGFDWKVNVSLLSALAAKENTVATLGALYQPEEGQEGAALEERMSSQAKGFTQLHALALMIFMALYPPCIATLIMVRLEAGKNGTRWMLLSLIFPICLGFLFASGIFTLGSLFSLTGLQAMGIFYILALLGALIFSRIEPRDDTPLAEGR